MEHQESLKTGAVVGETTDSVKGQVNDLLSDGVVTTGVVVRSVFLSGDELFRMEEGTVGSGTDLIWNMGTIWVTWNMRCKGGIALL